MFLKPLGGERVLELSCYGGLVEPYVFTPASADITVVCLPLRMDDIQLCKEITRLKTELQKLVSNPGKLKSSLLAQLLVLLNSIDIHRPAGWVTYVFYSQFF